MEYTTLGRTGLKVSVAGLGGGGGSQLGLDHGMSRANAIGVVRLARDLGVNLFDTAHSYLTEDVIGEALQGATRDQLVLCTKHQVSPRSEAKGFYPPQEIVQGLNESLRRLQTDYVDVFYVHSLTRRRFDYAINEVVPVLLREKDKGKFRFLGVTEAPTLDLQHETMQRALATDLFDVAMVGFQMMHQNARDLVFPITRQRNVGIVLMFVVRSIFANREQLRATFHRLTDEGKISPELAKDDPLDFLLHSSGAKSLVEVAYRFARHEPGVDVVLSGTGNVDHLRENIASIAASPLPQHDIDTIRKLLGHLVGEGLETPGRIPITAR